MDINSLNLGDGTRLGEVPTLQGLDLSQIGQMSTGEVARSKNRQYVRFYWKEFTESYATEVKIIETANGATNTQVLEKARRPIKKLMVQIITPGDKNEYDDVATDFHKAEYFRQYEAFKQGKGAILGTPLETVEFLDGVPGVVSELKIKGCHTLEQLADASDTLCEIIPDGFLWRKDAKMEMDVLQNNKSLTRVTALSAKVDELAEQNRRLQEQLSSSLVDRSGAEIVQERIVEVSAGGAPEKRGPGRPRGWTPKEDNETKTA